MSLLSKIVAVALVVAFVAVMVMSAATSQSLVAAGMPWESAGAKFARIIDGKFLRSVQIMPLVGLGVAYVFADDHRKALWGGLIVVTTIVVVTLRVIGMYVA